MAAKRTTMRLIRIRIIPALHPGLLAVFLLLSAGAALAHPMGNFSISHYAGIRVEQNAIQIRYLIDMAEIPAFQQIQQNGLATQPDDPSVRKYVASQAETLKSGLVLTLNGRRLPLQTESTEVIFPPGAGGLPTMKLGFTYRAKLPQALGVEEQLIAYHDDNFPSRVGWKEVIVTAGPGVSIVNTSVPQKDRSSELTNYPTDLVSSPPLDVAANVSVRNEALAADEGREGAQAASAARGAGTSTHDLNFARVKKPVMLPAHDAAQDSTPAAMSVTAAESQVKTAQSSSSVTTLQPNQHRTPQNRFTELMTARQAGMWFLVVAAFIAAGLGALHALEPGHGKTIVAAYLVGSKGTAYHAFLLGMIVTVSHTAGVYALGALTLYASRYIVPEQLYPWLGAVSGLIIAALGSYLFLRRYAGHEVGHSHGPGGHHHHRHPHAHEAHAHDGHIHGHVAHDHSHDHDHQHDSTRDHVHGDEHHGHTHAHHHEIASDVSYRQLLALGITGGIVPCPAALVVLLSAVALHRIAFGLFLIVAFSIGLAAVLIGVGLLMVYARRFMTGFRTEGLLFTRWLPLTSAAVITVLGLAIAVRSLITGGILQIRA